MGIIARRFVYYPRIQRPQGINALNSKKQTKPPKTPYKTDPKEGKKSER